VRERRKREKAGERGEIENREEDRGGEMIEERR
jgi:hypothetical protein